MKKQPREGCSYCDYCKKEVLAWTIREKLINGIFYSLCRTCQQESMIKEIKEEQRAWNS